MTNFWDPKIIADHVKEYMDKEDISTVFTFDPEGVSRHPNHIAVRASVLHLYQDMPDCTFYELVSRSLLRKYWGAIDFMACVFEEICVVNHNPIAVWKAMALHES